MDDRVAAAWAVLPDYLGQHVLLSAAALALGLAISLPLSVLSVRNARVRWPVLLTASIIQTIPGLALLALFYPLLLALSVLSTRLFGHGFSALGFLPSLLALTLYSMLPVIRNAVTGILNVDPAYTEAAQGVGMTRRQTLWQVELPVAAPVIMAGIRTSAVWVIGAATLSTPVGQTSLGNYIFSGLQLQNWVWVLFGCVAAAGLALFVDQALGFIQSGLALRSRWRIWSGASVLAIGMVFALAPRIGSDTATYRVGAKNFSEQYILADLISGRIAAEGGTASQRTGLGSTVAFNALVAGDIDVYVDYSGTLWANIMHRRDTPSRKVVLAELSDWLRGKYGVELLGSLGFENAYALAMKRTRALQLGIGSLADLGLRSPELAIGGDFEFFARPEWRALSGRYGLDFASRREYQSTFMYQAVKNDEVDVISAFSSDGRIVADDLLVLADPLNVVLPYDAVVLLAPGRAADPLLRRALSPLINAISVERMREANYRVDRNVDKESPGSAARRLAAELGLASRK
ncbi:MAG: ABC transporter permease/substrate-binding protein [Pseudomonadota bacterium]